MEGKKYFDTQMRDHNPPPLKAVRKYPRLCDLDISWSQFEQHYSQISDYLDGSLVLRGHGSVDAPSSTVKAFWSRDHQTA